MADRSALKHLDDADHVTKTGRTIYEKLRPKLEALPTGRHVVIDVATGEYVTGASMSAATAAFRKRYGKVPAYVRRIGHLIRV